MLVKQKLRNSPGLIVLTKNTKLFKPATGIIYDLPSPSGLSVFWNWGSLLGIILGSQLITGLFLSLHYVSSVEEAFSSVDLIARESAGGWLIRITHANGASLFFILVYLHTGRGLYYQSYRLTITWGLGVVMLFLLIGAAFLGYVLPWGQMSFWGATVITNLISAIPIVGQQIVEWLWGGFSVNQATLTRFFSFHFLVPFILTVLVLSHLIALHERGSSNPLGLPLMRDKVFFSPFYVWKDLVGLTVTRVFLFALIRIAPWAIGDPENFIPANPIVTPIHIQPEWYFLFAYAILRSVPRKLGGVVLLVLSILVLLTTLFTPKRQLRSRAWYSPRRWRFWLLVSILVVLTWIGARPIEEPYYSIGQWASTIYFGLFILLFVSPLATDKGLEPSTSKG